MTAPNLAQAAESREAILDAAERLFARQGFARTTIKDIGAEAGVNPALLYYYFADKQTLYRETLARLLRGVAEEGGRRLEGARSPAEAIERLVRGQVEMLLARPEMPRLIARELADHGAAHAEEAITRHMAGLFARVCEIIREGQRAGAFRPDLEPRYAAVSTISQVVYLFIARPAVGLLFAMPAGVPDEEMRAFGDHAARFALAALATHPGGAS